MNKAKLIENMAHLAREKRLEGIFCRCACHETDHLDGKLFIDLVDEFVEPEEEA